MNLLVIGDWVLDDSWVVGEHRSDLSTFFGRRHYRSLHHAGSAVKGHCGAGRAAAILRLGKWKGGTSKAHIYGLGLWTPSDSEQYLHRMFAPEHRLGGNCHRVVPDPLTAEAPEGVSLTNLGSVLRHFGYAQYKTAAHATSIDDPFLPSCITDDGGQHFFGTTRVFRFYMRSLTGLELMSRVDWELPPRFRDGDRDSSWFPPLGDMQNKDEATKALNDILDTLPSNIDGVVIKDNGKGVVSTSLLTMLLEKRGDLKQKPWFIQTKRWQPQYLDYLRKEVTVQALVYQAVALAQEKTVSTWITAQNGVSHDAINMLTALNASFEKSVPRRVCVVMPGQFSAVAVEARQDRNSLALLYQPHANPNRIPTEGAIGSATAFFSALIYGLLEDTGNQIYPQSLIDGALRVAQHWAVVEYDRLRRPESIVAPAELVLSIINADDAEKHETERKLCLMLKKPRMATPDQDSLEADDLSGVATVYKKDAKAEAAVWAAALSNFGIIELDGVRGLELSRSTIELRDFVCCAPFKRRQIADLKKSIAGFDVGHSQRALSGILTARPGSGKSSLVRNLAADLSLHHLSYNITNMVSFDDLLSCFDQIVTAQAETRDKTILVFVDEINASIANQSVYEAFLTPLEDGFYMRAGTKRFIKPCVWLFVGTTPVGDVRHKSGKGSDFVSRMSLDPMDISAVPKDERDYLHIENIYVGAFVARREFPGLMRLDRDVVALLAAFRLNEVNNGVAASVSHRDIRRLIGKELQVDGLGSARWRDLDGVLRKYASEVDDTLLRRNMDVLGQWRDRWINVYHAWP
jgi:hypothetical protein